MMVWSEFAGWMVQSPWAMVGLLLVGFALLFHEMLTPLTWGWTGSLGVLAVGAVFAAEWTVGAAGWAGILLMLLGLTLLLLEIHVWPGRGVCAVFGLLLLFAGMFQTLGATQRPAFALGVSTAVSLATLTAFFAYLPKSPRWRAIGHEILSQSSQADEMPHIPVAPGSLGTTTTELRPLGSALFDGVPYNVLTEGEFLEIGVAVRAERIERDRVVVEPVSENRSAAISETT